MPASLPVRAAGFLGESASIRAYGKVRRWCQPGGRKKVAQGVSLGIAPQSRKAPERGERSSREGILPPRSGAGAHPHLSRRLTPWATFFRSSGARFGSGFGAWRSLCRTRDARSDVQPQAAASVMAHRDQRVALAVGAADGGSDHQVAIDRS